MATMQKSVRAYKVHANHVSHPRIAKPAIIDMDRATAGPKRKLIEGIPIAPLEEIENSVYIKKELIESNTYPC